MIVCKKKIDCIAFDITSDLLYIDFADFLETPCPVKVHAQYDIQFNTS